ncbi:riboflavin kinase [Ammoniphilus sp. 3BR4]|uniref:riboflavin kinase n=1 Tax=Ammoniphilus sp. 3BR4 TaxID=3158265 RepID=UPI00346749CF
MSVASQNLKGLKFAGKVVSGQQKGRSIGFPTANLDYAEDQIETGVFGVVVQWKGKRFRGVMNIGYRPTFNESWTPVAEVHLLDFQQMIYGETLEVEFVFKIRDEKKFSSIDSLINRIREDVEYANHQFTSIGIS